MEQPDELFSRLKKRKDQSFLFVYRYIFNGFIMIIIFKKMC